MPNLSDGCPLIGYFHFPRSSTRSAPSVRNKRVRLPVQVPNLRTHLLVTKTAPTHSLQAVLARTPPPHALFPVVSIASSRTKRNPFRPVLLRCLLQSPSPHACVNLARASPVPLLLPLLLLAIVPSLFSTLNHAMNAASRKISQCLCLRASTRTSRTSPYARTLRALR